MKRMKKIVFIYCAIMAIVALVFFAFNFVYSNAILYEEKVTEAQSAIKVQEKRRADLLPILADAIKAYDQHEYETLMNIVTARQAKGDVITDDTLNEINQIISVVLEAYPELKSQENYKEFMNESAITENKIAETRDAYNKAVSRYNTYIRNPLNKFLLSIMGYERADFSKLSYDVSENAPTNLFD